jgi:lipopolysaccharide export system protein LptA
MTVHYAASDGVQETPTGTPAEGLRQKIARITAKDNVEIVQGDWVATGNTLDFNAAKRIAVLAGNAKAWQNQNMVSGRKITLYLNEGRSVVEGGTVEGERVKAFIYPGTEKSTDAAEPLQEK